MATVTDFNSLRKNRKRKRFIKAMSIIFLVLAVTFGISSLASTPNFVGLSSVLDIFKGGDGYPLVAPGGKSKGMYENSGNLIVVNETNLYMYNASGVETLNIQHRMTNPQIASRKNMVLNFDRGSKSYAAYSRATPFVSDKTAYAIKSGDISAGGEIVLATQSDTAQSTVTVFDSSQRKEYEWKTNDTVTEVAISDNGSDVAVSSISVEDGSLKSKITFLHNGKETGKKELQDEMLLRLGFGNDNNIRGITEKTAFICGMDGKINGQYDFKGQPLAGFDVYEGGAMIILGDFEQDRSYTMISLDNDYVTMNGSCTLTDNLQSLKIVGNTALVLGNNALTQYSTVDCEILSEDKADYIYDIQPMGNFVYAMTNNEIVRLPLSEPSQFSFLKKKAPVPGESKDKATR